MISGYREEATVWPLALNDSRANAGMLKLVTQYFIRIYSVLRPRCCLEYREDSRYHES